MKLVLLLAFCGFVCSQDILGRVKKVWSTERVLDAVVWKEEIYFATSNAGAVQSQYSLPFLFHT
jgi:hypothetical protein